MNKPKSRIIGSNSPSIKISLTIALVIIAVILLELSEKPDSSFKNWLISGEPARELNIATVAITPDIEPNITLSKIEGLIASIMGKHPETDLILFGEAITGYYRTNDTLYHKRIAEIIPGVTTSRLMSLARKNSVFISFGIAERKDSNIYNSQVLINDKGAMTDIHRKKNLKSSYFNPGEESISVSEIKGIKTGTVICYDITKKETLRCVRKENIELLLLSNADYSEPYDKSGFAYRFLGKQLRSWLVTSNRYGQEGDTFWDGHIEIINPFGDIISSGSNGEQYIFETIVIRKPGSKFKRGVQNCYLSISMVYMVMKNLTTAVRYYHL